MYLCNLLLKRFSLSDSVPKKGMLKLSKLDALFVCNHVHSVKDCEQMTIFIERSSICESLWQSHPKNTSEFPENTQRTNLQ
jgi:hypothetical protein